DSQQQRSDAWAADPGFLSWSQLVKAPARPGLSLFLVSARPPNRAPVSALITWSRRAPTEAAYHDSSEMSLCHSGSDQALAVLVRTFPNAPVVSANLATFSPLADSTIRSRSCSPEVR